MNDDELQYRLALNDLKHTRDVLLQKVAAISLEVNIINEMILRMGKCIETVEKIGRR